MFATAIRRAAKPDKIPYIYTNPYKARKLWPPDFAKLSPKYQFRLERKYKRRSKLKYARPTWTKITKIAQFGAITFILVYGVLFLEWNTQGTNHVPFEGIRSWFFGLTGGSIWTKDQVRKKDALDNSPIAATSTTTTTSAK